MATPKKKSYNTYAVTNKTRDYFTPPRTPAAYPAEEHIKPNRQRDYFTPPGTPKPHPAQTSAPNRGRDYFTPPGTPKPHPAEEESKPNRQRDYFTPPGSPQLKSKHLNSRSLQSTPKTPLTSRKVQYYDSFNQNPGPIVNAPDVIKVKVSPPTDEPLALDKMKKNRANNNLLKVPARGSKEKQKKGHSKKSTDVVVRDSMVPEEYYTRQRLEKDLEDLARTEQRLNDYMVTDYFFQTILFSEPETTESEDSAPEDDFTPAKVKVTAETQTLIPASEIPVPESVIEFKPLIEYTPVNDTVDLQPKKAKVPASTQTVIYANEDYLPESAKPVVEFSPVVTSTDVPPEKVNNTVSTQTLVQANEEFIPGSAVEFTPMMEPEPVMEQLIRKDAQHMQMHAFPHAMLSDESASDTASMVTTIEVTPSPTPTPRARKKKMAKTPTEHRSPDTQKIEEMLEATYLTPTRSSAPINDKVDQRGSGGLQEEVIKPVSAKRVEFKTGFPLTLNENFPKPKRRSFATTSDSPWATSEFVHLLSDLNKDEGSFDSSDTEPVPEDMIRPSRSSKPQAHMPLTL